MDRVTSEMIGRLDRAAYDFGRTKYRGMRKMNKSIFNGVSLFFLMFTLFGPMQPAMAQVDVRCIQQDCLKYGWESTDLTTVDYEFATCRGNGCSADGWLYYFKDGTRYEYTCLPGGCFTDGYKMFNLDFTAGRTLVGEVSCMANDCHRIGWIEKPENEKFVYVTLCKNQDCGQRGWTTRWRNLITTDSTCKVGGCFVNGWREQ